ncbi:MAG: prepilin peptidase [Desulfitobacterium sp.]|nr:prepilin peptidase [Desulfitobacterium sp.]
MGIHWSVFFGILGLVIGSFLNVIIFRLPKEESIISPGSHCPVCNHFLRPWELIPILSYVFLRGRCSQCKVKISWRYPLLEGLTGILFFLVAYNNKSGSFGLFTIELIFIVLLLVLAGIDWYTFRLPDIFTIPLIIIAIGARFYFPEGPTGWESFGTAVVAGGIFWLINFIYPDGMGLGDVKLIMGIGAFLGAHKVFIAIFIASLSGSLVGLTLLSLKKATFSQPIPFGPYLVFGALISFFSGDLILDYYAKIFFS